ncbi:MAG: hypothetical protein DRR08_22190 [Candidatus Parabeggiatoa sp. nov. 2]|nr:MAG: hypothetical protein DRR08_22190 [Gammaproteobacteria bacterium]
MVALAILYGCPRNPLWLPSQSFMVALAILYGCPRNPLWLPSQSFMVALAQKQRPWKAPTEMIVLITH